MEDLETEDYVKQLQEGSNNILVAVRSRPLTKKEVEIDETPVVYVVDDKVVVLMDPNENSPKAVLRQNRSRQKQYAFDYAFNENSEQHLVFERTTKFLIDGALEGYNATVFAYGPTGAGKTYTMLGSQDRPGLMLNTFLEIFTRIEKYSIDKKYNVKISYLEIYNEVVRDLLNPNQENLDVREDPVKGVVVAGLSEISASSPENVVSSIKNGNINRTCEPTEANQESSRSHAVLQIVIEHKDRASGTEAEVLVGKLSLIDLAGSERASNTRNRGIRLIEGANINRSLLALGNCINALCEATDKIGKIYIPYRDSKLTRILKDSLGGNCRTVMIACVSPFSGAFEETLNTLKYANRAKNIKTNLSRNVLSVQYNLSKYNSIIAQLKEEISNLRSKLSEKQGSPTGSSVVNKHLLDMNSHFQEEALCRRTIHQSEQSIEQIDFEILARKSELITISNESGTNSKEHQTKLEEIQDLENSKKSFEEDIKKETEKKEKLEAKRKELKAKLDKQKLNETSTNKVELEFQKHVSGLENLEKDRKHKKHEAVVKQKNIYISLLEDQIKARDNALEVAKELFRRNAITPENFSSKLDKLQTLEQISTNSVLVLPEINPKRTLLDTNSHSKSKIPKPRNRSLNNKSTLIEPKLPSKSPAPNGPRPNPYYKLTPTIKRRNVSNISIHSFDDNEPRSRNRSLNGGFNPKKVSEKVYQSPYVKKTDKKRLKPGYVKDGKAFQSGRPK